MSSQVYEIISLLMRYVFVLIGALIVWRAFRWILKDHQAYQREIKYLPDAGRVGEIVNLSGGVSYPLPREGTIGSAPGCDIRIRGNGVHSHHVRFEFVDGKGLKIIPARSASVELRGETVRKAAYALHGTQFTIGDVHLRVRLFAGLNVPRHAAFQPDEDAVPLPEPPLPALEPWVGLQAVPLPVSQAVPSEPSLYPPAYEGHYTFDSQMTWEYAYDPALLRQAAQPKEDLPWTEAPPLSDGDDEEDVPIPYPSPLPRRRRRSRK